MKIIYRSRITTVFLFSLLWLFVYSTSVFSQYNINKPNWDELKHLVGEWVGDGSGDPGQGTGTYSFTFNLDERILTRKNHTEYPANNGRPAFSHDDLMIIYFDQDKPKAIYFDNEGHTINYNVVVNGDTVLFISDVIASSPRFRLSYVKTSDDSLKIIFEIAMSSDPGKFNKYLEGTSHRKKL